MQAKRRVAVTLIVLAAGTLIDGVAREDVLMIALGLLLAATSMQVFNV